MLLRSARLQCDILLKKMKIWSIWLERFQNCTRWTTNEVNGAIWEREYAMRNGISETDTDSRRSVTEYFRIVYATRKGTTKDFRITTKKQSTNKILC